MRAACRPEACRDKDSIVDTSRGRAHRSHVSSLVVVIFDKQQGVCRGNRVANISKLNDVARLYVAEEPVEISPDLRRRCPDDGVHAAQYRAAKARGKRARHPT